MVGGNLYTNANAGTLTNNLTISGTFPAEWVGTYQKVYAVTSQEQSLPNITGQIQPVFPGSGFIPMQNMDGALSEVDTSTTNGAIESVNGTKGTRLKGIKLDASKSNSTYGRSSEVRVANITIKIWERIA